jgi:phage terminase large subunit-like protein
MPADGALMTLGFDGGRWHDATALVGTEIVTGFQCLLGLWEKPEMLDIENWEVPAEDVKGVVAEAFERWQIWRMYCDPPYWESIVAEWAGKYGEKRVLEWWTNRQKQMAYAIKSFSTAISSGELLHDGNPHLARHIGNAVRRIEDADEGAHCGLSIRREGFHSRSMRQWQRSSAGGTQRCSAAGGYKHQRMRREGW